MSFWWIGKNEGLENTDIHTTPKLNIIAITLLRYFNLEPTYFKATKLFQCIVHVYLSEYLISVQYYLRDIISCIDQVLEPRHVILKGPSLLGRSYLFVLLREEL